jgi:hypothetical protein
MEEYIEQLLELQKLDVRLDRLREDLERIPGEIAIHERDKEKRRREHEKVEEELREAERLRGECEDEKRKNESRLVEYRKQLLDLKTNEEYRSMLKQIDYTEKRIDDLESEILELLYQEEENGELIERARRKLEKSVARCERRKEALESERLELEEEIALLEEQRDELAEDVKQRYLRKYSQLREAGKGRAVVGLIRGACGGCMTNVPPQSAVEIKSGKTFTCPICGRYVVWTEDSSFAEKE